MKNSEYWKRRFEQLEDEQYRKTERYYKDIENQFRMAQNSVQMDIEKWYWRLADNNDISYAAAKKILKKNELEEFHWTVEEYIKYGQENALNQRWMKQLENASARVHISRLEAIKLQIQQQAEKLFAEYEESTSEFLKGMYSDSFYHTAYEIAKGTGVGSNLAKLDQGLIDTAIRKPWAQDGSNFSDRIWTNKKKLINTLHTELAQNVIRGENPEKAAKRISEQMGVSMWQAKRLIYTESAAISSSTRRDCLKELGVEQYEIVATLDSRTSDICREMDGKVFDMKEYQVGLTAPPFHCNCRSCTCPYFNDEFTVGEERVARSEETGRTYYVPADIVYDEWFEKFVGSSPDEMMSFAKTKNIEADRRQYENYRKRLGRKYLPSTFDDFQNVKYGDEKEYGILKAQYKGMKYYENAVNNEPLITGSVKSIANRTGLSTYGLEHKLKTKDSYLRKIRAEHKPSGNVYEVKDIIRYTLGVENSDNLVEKMNAAIDEFTELCYNTVVIKNTWRDKLNPYKGINTTVIAPNGQKFEVQYHTKESFEAKEKMHKLYEEWRAIEDKASEEAIGLSKEMASLSKKLTVPKNIEKVK